jgi:hypothetical protein
VTEVRTRTDRCPLCRVAFHNVSQALESSQANTLWPEPDHRITLRSLVQKPMVYYGDKRVGRIALYSRTLNYEPDRHTSSLAHLKMLSASNLGFGMLRAVRREVFNRNWSMIPEFYNNLPIRSKIRLSRLFDIKTPEYYYYSTLPNVSPPQRIDLSFLREALRECEEGHSRKCGANLGVSDGQLPTDILLIDVVENRLVKISTSCQKYLALSYVWGSVPMFKTTQENLASLQEPGAFLHLRSQLPRILRDAMDLTHYLGHRYLWCDALCIVQNDIQFKHSQIAKMSLIYGQAFLTICALSSSDAGVGLLGFSETLPGDMPQDTFGLTKTCAYVSMTPILEDISHLLPYEQRAWTVQERLLSKRCLLFTATHIYFHCQDGMSSSNAYGRRFSKMELGGSGYWDPLPKFWGNNGGSFGVKLYTILVEKYTLRNLSYPEDVIDAFTAISLSFESYYSTRIQKGIPEPVFLVVLCWLGKKALKRRKQVLDQPLHPSRVFPSWSWVGWEGPITFVNNQSFLDISEGEYQSYVSNFVLEEGEQLLKLNHKRYNQQHPDCCQTVIPVSLTRHQSVLHFMAYSIDSSLFRLGITKSSFQDAILYQIAEDEGQILSREQLLPEAPEAVSQSSQRLQGLQEESCCGCLQLNDLNLRSENGVINDCIYVLLSTMNVRFYNKEAWSCGFPWFDGGRNRDMNKWLLNAILLTEQNGVWVRIGIAIFTQEAWNNAGPQERYIQLA